MPLPFLVGGLLAGGAILKAAAISEKKDAKEKFKEINIRNEENVEYLESCQTKTMQTLDSLGMHEAEILKSFQFFASIFEKIHSRADFKEIIKDNIILPEFTPKELKEVAAGASAMLADVVSTGSGLAYIAATGGFHFGGGIMGIRSAFKIPMVSFGPALLITGMIDCFASVSLQIKAQDAWKQMLENEEKINSICEYLNRLENVAGRFDRALCRVNGVYQNNLSRLEEIVDYECDYGNFSHEEKLVLENTVLLVGLLYEMCKVQLVEKSDCEDELNEINEYDVDEQIEKSNQVLYQIKAPTDIEVFEYEEVWDEEGFEPTGLILTGIKDKSLTEIVIPDTVIEIGNKAFYRCNSLVSVDIPHSVTKIGDSAFDSCDSLEHVYIPDSVWIIGDRAFYRCSSLEQIEIPDSVTEIGRCAFYGCDSLKSVEIPDSVTEIGDSAFDSSIEIIYQ